MLFHFSEDELEEFHGLVSKNVRDARKRKEISQLDLAIELGLKNSSFISHAENTKRTRHNYSLEHLYKISKILEIDICELLK